MIDDVMVASNDTTTITDGDILAYVEGTCTVINEPTLEEISQGMFQKLFCDIVYDFGMCYFVFLFVFPYSA